MLHILTILAFLAVPALGENLFVDSSNPEGFATIGDAVKRADEGDVIFISEGFYAESITLDKNVSLIGEGADRVILSFAQEGNAINIGSANDTTTHIEGMTIIAKRGAGIAAAPGGGATIRSCIIRNSRPAISLNTSRSVVQLNQLIENQGALWSFLDQGSLITNNIIKDNEGGPSRSGWTATVFFVDQAADAVFANNLLKGNTGATAALALFADLTIANNVIVNSDMTGISIGAGGPAITSNIIAYNTAGIFVQNATPIISYNDVYDNTDGDYTGSASDDIGGIRRDAEFADPGKDDYHLQEGSPCIDKGAPGSAHADPDGSRNDMGIYGGPFAAFWTEPYTGPVVTSLEVSPASVQQGGTITIRATGSTVRE